MMKRHKRENPQKRGGSIELTPEVFRDLVNHPLGAPGSPIVLLTLSPTEALSTRMVHNARLLLDVLHEAPQKLTEKHKQLNRRLVREMLSAMQFDDEFMLMRQEWPRVDEDQVWPLFVVRHVIQYSGLARVLHGKLLITKLGEKLRDQARVGELHRLLFETYFLKYNIASLDGYDEDETMQAHAAFVLFRLGTLLRKPTPLGDFADRLPHDEAVWAAGRLVASEFCADPASGLHGALTRRLLRPLAEFGLLEASEEAESGTLRDRVLKANGRRMWSVTPLFDDFVALRVAGAQTPLCDVVLPSHVERADEPPSAAPMGVEESIRRFCRDAAKGDRDFESELAARLVTFEMAARMSFMGREGSTPVERAIAAIPTLMTPLRQFAEKPGHEHETVGVAAVWAAYVQWSFDRGQVRQSIASRALAALDPLLPEEMRGERWGS